MQSNILISINWLIIILDNFNYSFDSFVCYITETKNWKMEVNCLDYYKIKSFSIWQNLFASLNRGGGGEASLNGFQRLSSVFVMHQGSREVARVSLCSWICHQHCTKCCTGHKYHFCCVAFLVFVLYTHTHMSSDSHWPFYDCKSKNMWSSNQMLGPYIFFLLKNTSATCLGRLCHDDCEFWRTAGLFLNMSVG